MLFGHEKVSFLHLPTPIEFLPRMSEKLGIELYIKRDDLTNLGMGGNKLRKLEYLLYDAQQKGATMLLTLGGAQTNHGRLTAAVAAKYGMRCAILCIDDYPGEVSANILLDRLMGAEVVLKKSDGRDEGLQFRELTAQMRAKYEAQGEVVYEIPIGGSNVIGCLGYFECAQELGRQVRGTPLADSRLICGVGSLGTYIGLYAGLRHEASSLRLTGVAISPFADAKEARLREYYDEMQSAFGFDTPFCRDDFDIETGYTREGYNKPNAAVRQAIYDMASTEAIILDPCYTGKMFAGVCDMVREGKLQKGERVILLHSGGQPGISTPFHRVEMERELMSGVTIL